MSEQPRLGGDQTGDLERARSLLAEAISEGRKAGLPLDMPLLGLAIIAQRERDYRGAEDLLLQSLDEAGESGDVETILRVTAALAWNSLSRRRLKEGTTRAQEAIDLAEQLQHRGALRECAELLAVILARKRKLTHAAQLFGKAEALGDQLGFSEAGPKPLLQKAQARGRRELGHEAWAAALIAGRDADLHDLLEDGVRNVDSASV